MFTRRQTMESHYRAMRPLVWQLRPCIRPSGELPNNHRVRTKDQGPEALKAPDVLPSEIQCTTELALPNVCCIQRHPRQQLLPIYVADCFGHRVERLGLWGASGSLRARAISAPAGPPCRTRRGVIAVAPAIHTSGHSMTAAGETSRTRFSRSSAATGSRGSSHDLPPAQARRPH